MRHLPPIHLDTIMSDTQINTTESNNAKAKNSTRRRRLTLLAAAVSIAIAGYGAYWSRYASHYQSTEDAYVSGDLVQITSEVPGTVTDLNVDDTQSVQRDQVLLKLDPADAKVQVDTAEANLAQAVRQVRTVNAQVAQLKAQVRERESDLKRARDDYDRRAILARDGVVSREELSHTQDAIAQAEASVSAAREQLNATTAQIDGTTIKTNPQVLAATAAVRDAALALKRTQIAAPVAGVVARRSVQVGQRVAAGTPLMAVVPLDGVWVDANFKEGQLKDMRIGQPVTLRADIYGGSTEYHGKLAGVSAGSGGAFALLPAQNASGNWIKIVQRVPVRITLDPQELKAHPLRVGLSMSVDVDVQDTSGPLISDQVRDQPVPQQASRGDDPVTEIRIAQIIAENTGQRPPAAVARNDLGRAAVNARAMP